MDVRKNIFIQKVIQFGPSLILVLQLRQVNNDAFFVKAKFQKVSNDLISM